jgi:hypothetical protein
MIGLVGMAFSMANWWLVRCEKNAALCFSAANCIVVCNFIVLVTSFLCCILRRLPLLAFTLAGASFRRSKCYLASFLVDPLLVCIATGGFFYLESHYWNPRFQSSSISALYFISLPYIILLTTFHNIKLPSYLHGYCPLLARRARPATDTSWY